ncbi:hypothetical protein [Sphingosinicella sp. BN140058]|uniref:hypothetical protein n=1 Tax=Sphingosinicella sp. BN140058 TaxID=1892855 RepID=UPI00101389D4|nr:hypothetical protein [Sphingosinicella sp. BN140058]QAY77907.1 hypothetical protein ETR14_16300 [Sphingosinicella sp. BN140058]
MTGPIALLRFTADGEMQMCIAGEEPIRFLVVDDRCPNDRVYEVTTRIGAAEFARIVPEDASVGSKADERHEALVARIEAAINGRSHLRSVE